MPWKPRAESCYTSSETAARSTGSWGCRSGPARRRDPPGRPPRSWCPLLTWGAPGWPWPRCRLRAYCRGRTWRAAWTVWWWAALREYASQQLGSAPPDWCWISRARNSLWREIYFLFFIFYYFLSWVQRMEAREVWERHRASDDWVLDHLHRMCQPQEHQGLFFTKFSRKTHKQSPESLSLCWTCRSYLWWTVSAACLPKYHHKLFRISQWTKEMRQYAGNPTVTRRVRQSNAWLSLLFSF